MEPHALPVGAWTNQTTVVLRFAMTDASPTDSLVPEIEIKPVTTAFSGSGLRAGSPVRIDRRARPGQRDGHGTVERSSYHWRARVRDASGQVSGWASFGGNAEISRDVAVDTAPPSGSVTIDGGAAWSDTPTVSLKLTLLGHAERVRGHAAQQRQCHLHPARALRGDADMDARGR